MLPSTQCAIGDMGAVGAECKAIDCVKGCAFLLVPPGKAAGNHKRFPPAPGNVGGAEAVSAVCDITDGVIFSAVNLSHLGRADQAYRLLRFIMLLDGDNKPSILAYDRLHRMHVRPLRFRSNDCRPNYGKGMTPLATILGLEYNLAAVRSERGIAYCGERSGFDAVYNQVLLMLMSFWIGSAIVGDITAVGTDGNMPHVAIRLTDHVTKHNPDFISELRPESYLVPVRGEDDVCGIELIPWRNDTKPLFSISGAHKRR